MKKIAVIGGGIAGLSAAVFLVNSGFYVELYEASPKLGGRASSFKDEITGDIIDNGQHILMGCYKETLQFFKLINAFENIDFQKKLKINFLDKEKGIIPLNSVTTLYPFNLILGILNYRMLDFNERINLLKTFFKLAVVPTDSLNNLTISEWLKNENQSKNILKSFWEILVIGAMNTTPEKASAKLFADILKQIFFRGNKSATILLPETGLEELYCGKASDFIKKQYGRINLLSRVSSVRIIRNKIVSFEVNGKNTKDFDYIISAVPLYTFRKIFSNYPELQYENLEFKYSPILNIHIWLKENTLTEKFYGLIDSPVQWIFNHKNHLTIVISDAGKLIDLSNEEISSLVIKEIYSYYPGIKIDSISRYKVIKEKRATFIPGPSVLNIRPQSRTAVKNLFIAGDWTDSKLPATIEGAVKSGKIAANLVINEV